jgi:sugar lactone lactonase YvrE
MRISYAVAALAVVSFGVVCADEPMNIVTVAGRMPFTGDGGPALAARIGAPLGIAADAAGNILVGDTSDNLVRFVNRTGQSVTFGGQPIQAGKIASIAGTGLAGYNGDGIPATLADVTEVTGITFDAPRNVFYISDTFNQRIRKIDPVTGIITTVAGTGQFSFNGNTDPQTGHPLATEANLTFPGPPAFDASGNFYVNDGGGAMVRRVDAVTGFISTVAGGNARAGTATAGSTVVTMSDTSGFSAGIAVFGPGLPPLGATVVSVTPNLSITIAPAPTQGGAITLTTTARGYGGDGGPATAAMIYLPVALFLDPSGNLYISDAVNQRVFCVNLSNANVTVFGKVIQPGNIATVVGGGTGPFSDPAQIGDGGPATAAHLGSPGSLAFDSEGNLFISDGGYRIRRVDHAAATITTIAGGIPGNFKFDLGPSNQGAVGPAGITVDGSGNLLIADDGFNCVRMIAPPLDGTGIISTVAGGGTPPLNDNGPATAANLNSPALIAFDASGNLFFVDSGNNRIRRIDATTQIITTVVGNGGVTNPMQTDLGDGGPSAQATVNNATGLTFDASGNLYFCDTNNNRVRMVAPPLDGTQTITTVVGGTGTPTDFFQSNLGDGGEAIAATCNRPRGPAFDLSGNLYFADVNNARIRKVTLPDNGIMANGIITTVVGTGVFTDAAQDNLGDNGPANQATVNGARFVTFDAYGNLYTPDVNNLRVRKVTAHADANGKPLPLRGCETITTVAGNGLLYATNHKPFGDAATSYSITNPRQIAPTRADASGAISLYFVDFHDSVLYKVTATDGVIDGDADDLFTGSAGSVGDQTVNGFNGDGIPATSALLNTPVGVALDASGNIYIGDYGNNRIRRLNVAAKTVSVNTNADGAGGIAARVELNSGRTPSQLSGVTLRAVDALGGVLDASGHPTDAFSGTDLGADPTDAQAEVFNFGSHPALLGGAGFRVEAVFSQTDGKAFSGDARFSIAWSPPTNITYGTLLSSAQLNATASALGVDITGNTTVTYNPPLGTVLNAVGGRALQAHFVPNNPTLGTADWTVPINVTYGISPLYDPTKIVNSGADIPLKLYLSDVNSTDVSSSSVVLHATALTQAGTGTPGVLTADFRFDPTLGPSGGYILNLKTTGLSTGTWQLSFTVSGDPVTHSVSFQIR